MAARGRAKRIETKQLAAHNDGGAGDEEEEEGTG